MGTNEGKWEREREKKKKKKKRKKKKKERESYGNKKRIKAFCRGWGGKEVKEGQVSNRVKWGWEEANGALREHRRGKQGTRQW